MRIGIYLITLMLLLPVQAQAGFIISSAILEFTGDGPRHQDVEVMSQSDKNDYVVAEISEIVNPGGSDEARYLITDASQSGLLVSPDKMVLAARNHKILRFILLKEPDDKEHIYRVAVKPVIKDMGTSDKVGLKMLIGYEVLVIVRPQVINSSYTANRQGDSFTVVNTGNADVLFQNGKQCPQPSDCKNAPVLRVYAGQKKQVTLPSDVPVFYSVWDGKTTNEKQF